MTTISDAILKQWAKDLSPEVLREKLKALAAGMGNEAFANRVAREIVELTQPHMAIPDIYAPYRLLVRDGIVFFLSRIHHQRLVDLVLDQAGMDPSAPTEERLLALAQRFPTLHKLGQIIARNPAIDPVVKHWLVRLEHGHYGTPRKRLLQRIHRQLKKSAGRSHLHIQPTLLAEASVGAVFPFLWAPSPAGEQIQGVFKILKPHIRRHLSEELAVLELTAAFFERNRARYPLRDFQFLEIFHSVRDMLVREIDLSAEQRHLLEAARFYSDMDAIRIPRLLPFGTDEMTAMGYLHGPRITDAHMTSEQRRYIAGILFEALVCRPLFSRDEPALFHGDPHAGNILAVRGAPGEPPRIALLDWSLAGRLEKPDRVRTVQLIQALYKRDLNGICNAVLALAAPGPQGGPIPRPRLRNRVIEWIQSPSFVRAALMKKAFQLLETLSQEGVVFPAELMLFRKGIFTLEGVLNDLWPAFDMDAAVTRYLTTLITREVPARLGYFFFPLADRPENYPSLISNLELHSLMIHQSTAALKSGLRTWGDFLTKVQLT